MGFEVVVAAVVEAVVRIEEEEMARDGLVAEEDVLLISSEADGETRTGDVEPLVLATGLGVEPREGTGEAPIEGNVGVICAATGA